MRRLARLALAFGVVVAVFGLSKFHAAEVASPPYDFTESSRFGWALVYIGLLGGAAYGFGLPDLTRTRRSIVGASVISTLAAAAAISAVQLVVGTGLLPRYVVFGSVLLLIPWFWICANLAGDGRSRDEERDRVVVIGSWADAADLTLELERGAERPASVVATLEPDELRPTASQRRPLRAVVEAERASVVVLDREAQNDPRIIGQVAELHEQGVRVRTLSLFYEQWLGKLPVAELERVSLFFDIGEVHRSRYARQRRVLDIAVGLVGLVPLAIVAPFVMVANLFGNKGPMLFRQSRVGQNGEPFEILKFRSMTAGGDSTTWTQKNDPRITPFGNFLRRSHLDELPQVINILAGDIALVGPRPEQQGYVDELREKLPFYDLRHLVKPGLTGWAQVKYGYAGDEGDALEKLQYEFYYLRHQDISFDIRIVVRTVRSVLRGFGR